MFKVIFANLRRRKLRLLATALAVLFGVAFTSGTLVLTDTLNSTFNNLFGNIYAGTSAVVQSTHTVKGSVNGFGGGTTRSDISQSVMPAIEATPGVRAVHGVVFGYAQIIQKNGKALGNPNRGAPTIGGAWDPDPQLSPSHLYRGRAPARAGEVVVDNRSIKLTGYGIGDRIAVLTPKGRVSVTIVGISKFGKSDSSAGASEVDFTTAQAQQLVGTVGQFTEIHVAAKPGVSQAQLVANLEKTLPTGTRAITGKAAAKAQEDLVKTGLSFFSTILLVFGIVGLVVGAFIIANTFSILVAQRTRELALLRALGASRNQVLSSVVLEAAFTGLVGAVLGLLVGVGLAGVLLQFTVTDANTPEVLAPTTILAAFVIGVGITTLSAIFPAVRAANIAPVAAMRESAVETPRRRPVRAIIGGAFLLLGIISAAGGAFGKQAGLVGLGAALCLIGAVIFGPVLAVLLGKGIGVPARAVGGLPARLGQENVLRNPKRTASTASALMIGVFLVAGITVFAASALASINKLVDTNFKGQFVVESTGNGLPQSLQTTLAADPRLGTSAGLTYVPVGVGQSGALAVSTQPASLEKLYDMQVLQGSLGAIGDTGVGVTRATARTHHWTLGSPVDLTFIDGKVHHFTVKAIFKTQPFLRAQILGTNAAFASALPNAPAQVIFVADKPGASNAQTRAVLDELTASNPTAKVNDNAQFKAETASQLSTLLNVIYALLGFAVIIAVFGVVNTLGLSILERTRELGLLRAVGMSRKQLRTSIRVEAILIALTGTVVGIVLGSALGAAVLSSVSKSGNLATISIPVVRLAVIFVAGILVGLVAAILPAWRAARLDPLRALTVE